MTTLFETHPGLPYPLGATQYAEGVNFALFSKHAQAVSLCLFQPDAEDPCCEIPFDPDTHKTGDVWHLFVYHLPAQSHYGYRVDGPYAPLQGHYFDNQVILLDPYAKQVASSRHWGKATFSRKGIVSTPEFFDWEGDKHPNIPYQDLVLYEMHVRGFTQDPSSNIEKRGTFMGIIEKIPYLKSLGINAVELMPLFEFYETENNFQNPETGERLCNYWGYSTVNFFSPMKRYGTGEQEVATEFKTLVKALHANGIEVIVDVVYNHTCEGGKEGTTLSFKGIDSSSYYMFSPHGEYYNFSGCGNTLHCNHPAVKQLICDSLRYWVAEMHVDGFRFDLASILVRSSDGTPLPNPALIDAITQDPILAKTKLIAEAWDTGGLYQVGSFPGRGVWSEWNGRYRDDIRNFIKGTDGAVGPFATRLRGSEDLYGKDKSPTRSINFITAHDGFTLTDLVTYNQKQNLVNGEEDRDGDNNNLSWNCGAEGVTEDAKILLLRERQRKNFHVALMVSQGVPMLLMGDEYGHTKGGNNNTWGHDSRLNWFQWDTLENAQPFFRFYQKMIAFRKSHPIFTSTRLLSPKDIIWHGVEPKKANWSGSSRFIAFSLVDPAHHYTLYIAFDASYEKVTAHLPHRRTPWRQCVYTFLSTPHDIVEEREAEVVRSSTFTLAPHSALILKEMAITGTV